MLDNLKQIYKYRGLLFALVKRQLSMRYRGSVLGFFWSFINPLLLMLVYTLVFRYFIRFEQVNNYSLFLFCGLLPWIWFTSALSEGTNSIVGSGHLITKSMFPAHLLPTVSVITSFVHFILSLPLLFIFMFAFGISVPITAVFLPIIVILQFCISYGIVLALSAVNVHYRDVQHLLANALTFLFFLCPVIYPLESVPQQFRFTMHYNPIAQLTIFYHQVLLEGVWPSFMTMLAVAVVAIISLYIGNLIFNYFRESLAEVL
jgi:lipopolysaccharide transport system permease protein